MGSLGGAVCHTKALSALVRAQQAFGIKPLAFSLELAPQGQDLGGEGPGRFEGASVLAAQRVNPSGGQRQFLTTGLLHFA